MSSNNFFKSDLFGIYNIIQASMLVYPKEVIISSLRDFFSKDSYYHYAKDQWGFANTTDHTDLPLGDDVPTYPNQEGLSTRVFIGENFRYDGIYYPAILVKSGTTKYVPITFNRNYGTVEYGDILFEDSYGHKSIISRPKSFITAGVWEGSVTVDVKTRSLRARDDIVELIGMFFTEITFDTLYDIGVIVKPISVGAPAESEDRNDKLFTQTLTLDIRNEWRREIPIGNLIETILFSVEFSNLSNPNAPVAANLTINTDVSLIEGLIRM